MSKTIIRPRPENASPKLTIQQQNPGFTRDDLRRDTYVPTTGAGGFPRQHKLGNRQVG